jgi:hypothetical protein
MAAADAPCRLSSLPQAVNPPLQSAVANTVAASVLQTLPSFTDLAF